MSEINGEYEVVIIGAGIIGSCTAYETAKRNKSVLLLEQFDFLHHRGSSHGESRTIRQTYPEQYYVQMMDEAFQLWEQAHDEIGYQVINKTRQLDMGPAQNSSLKSVINSCKSLGVPVEILSPEEVSRRFKIFRLPEDWVGIVTERAGVLRASKAVAMFQALALKHGAKLRDNTKANKIRSGWKLSDGSDGVLVCTNRGSVLARKCVIAAGAWSQKLTQDFPGFALPIKPLHTTIAYWKIAENAESFSGEEGFPTFAVYGEPYLYGTPSLEYPGLVKVSLHGGYPCDPDCRDLVPDFGALKAMVSPWLAECFGGTVESEKPVLAQPCMYAMTPDEDFVMDFLPTEDGSPSNVLIASGFSGHGFKMAPLVGRLMADLALQGHTHGVPLEYFSIRRFAENPMGNKKGYADQVTPVIPKPLQ